VFEHREEAKQVGARAREHVVNNWTWDHSYAKIKQRLSVLWNNRSKYAHPVDSGPVDHNAYKAN